MPALLSASTVLARSDRVSWRVLEGDALILHPEAGTLHRLNGTGTRVWELLDGVRSLDAIAAALTDEYDVNATEAIAQVAELGTELITNGLASEVTA